MGANVNAPVGFRPVFNLLGSPLNGGVLECYLAAGTSGSYFIGDPVTIAGDSDQYIAGAPSVSIASAGTGYPIFGVIVGFRPDPTNLALTYRTTLTARYCYVQVAHPWMVWEIQADSTAAVAYTDVGSNVNFAAGGGGSTITGLSSWVAATTSMTTTSTYQGKILAVSQEPSNVLGNTYATLLVTINLCWLGACCSNASAGSTYIGGVGV